MPFVHEYLPQRVLQETTPDEEVFFHAVRACGYTTAILNEFADMHPSVLYGGDKMERAASSYLLAKVRALHRLLTSQVEPPTRRAM